MLEKGEFSTKNEPAVYCTVRFGYFWCSHGISTRPSAIVFKGKSRSGSWSQGLVETRVEECKGRTRC